MRGALAGGAVVVEWLVLVVAMSRVRPMCGVRPGGMSLGRIARRLAAHRVYWTGDAEIQERSKSSTGVQLRPVSDLKSDTKRSSARSGPG